MKVVDQLCIKSYEINDSQGNHWKAQQGEIYKTTVPQKKEKMVTVFSTFWVQVPKEYFVPKEKL